MLESLGGHAGWTDVDIEHGAALPRLRLEEAPIGQQPVVERRAREGRHDRDLHVEQAALGHEIRDGLEDLGPVTVEAQHEAAVDCYPVPLDAFDCGPIVVEPPSLPVPPKLHALDPFRSWAFEPDEDLRAACLLHERKQLRIVRDGDIGLGEPADPLVHQRTHQVLAVAPMDEWVVVGELAEGTRPGALDLAYPGDALV